jgi:high-affinity iron transporter
MLATAIIVFRETLEAALVVSIIVAATYGVRGRGLWVGSGVALGALGACVVATFAGAITAAAEGLGQELLNASILILAVLMLGWHTIWMSQHGREIAREMSDVGKAVTEGDRPLSALAVAAGAAVLREGSETVLFIYGIASSGDDSAALMIAGGVLGGGAGVTVGLLLYCGLLSIPLRYLFSVTNAMILLLTAGLAAQAAGLLVQVDVIPALGGPVWDTTWLLSEMSLPGKVLHTLVGYESRPAGVQVLCYVVVLGGLMLLSYAVSPKRNPRRSTRAGILVAAMTAVSAGLLWPHEARAEFKIRYPNIDYREVEVEHNYSVTFDKRRALNNDVSSPVEIGAGILPWWFVELEGEIEKHPGENTQWEATTLESYFMLTEPGKYWLDFAIFAEYGRQTDRHEPDTVELGLLFQKQYYQTLHTLNLFWEKQVGAQAEPIDTFQYAWQTRYLMNRYFQPGFEIYGEIEDLNRLGSFNQQQFRAGPMFAGSVSLAEIFGVGKVKYEASYLFGATSATEHGTLRTRLEIEFPF